MSHGCVYISPDVEPYQRAAFEAARLEQRHRMIARDLLTAADRLANTPLSVLAKTPVKHMHSSARKQEEALDEALMAL